MAPEGCYTTVDNNNNMIKGETIVAMVQPMNSW